MTTYDKNIMYHVKERTATAVSPRLSLAAPAGGLPTQAHRRWHECHAGVCMQCWSVARRPNAAPPGRGCSPRLAGPGALPSAGRQVGPAGQAVTRG